MIRPRFSLRFVFLVVTMLAIGLAVFIVPGLEKQRRIERLSRLGVVVDWDESQWPGPGWIRSVLGKFFFIKPLWAEFRQRCPDNASAFDLIAEIPSISGVKLGNPPATAQDIAKLKKLPALDTLFADSPIDDAGAAVIGGLASLKTLGLNNAHISDVGVANLVGLDRLQDLFLNQDTSISDTGLLQIIQLKNLKNLALRNTSVAFHVSRNADNLSLLESLSLSKTNVDDKGVLNLAGLRKLKFLDLAHTKVTNRAIKTIEKLPNLERLDLSETTIDDEGLKALAQCKSLIALTLDHTNITDDGLSALSNLSSLYELSIQGTAITDQGLKLLDNVPSLMVINAQGTKITAAGVTSAAAYNSDRQVEISPPAAASVP